MAFTPPRLGMLLAIVLTVAGGYTGRAQDDLAEPTAAVVEQTEPEVPTELPPTQEPPAVPLEPPAVPVTPEEPPAAPTDVTEPQSGEADTDAGIDTAAVAPAPNDDIVDPVPTLSFTPDLRPTCVLTPGQPDAIAHGGSQEFACSHTMQVSAQDLDPDSIAIDWAIQAAVDGGWAVQILPPADAAQPHPEWTAEGQANVALTHHEAESGGGEAVPSEPFTQQRSLSFGLRVHRALCGAVAESVDISVAALASTPGVPDAVVTNLAPLIEPSSVVPPLAPIPEPSVAFDGPLDLGTVGISAAGPDTSETAGTLAITVSNLDQTCGTWSLTLDAERLEGGNDFSISAANLSLNSVNGAEFQDGGCALDDGCEVAQLEAGPEADSTTTLNIGVALQLPEETSAATFSATLTATLTATNS